MTDLKERFRTLDSVSFPHADRAPDVTRTRTKAIPTGVIEGRGWRRSSIGEGADTPHSHPVRAAVVLAAALALIGTTLYALRDLGGSDGNTAVPGPGEVMRYQLDGPAQAIAVGEGAAWVHVGVQFGKTTLVRIDGSTGESRTVGLPGGSWPAVGGGSAWWLCDANPCGHSSVLQIDPATGEIIRKVALPDVGEVIAGSPRGVWVGSNAGASFIDAEGTLERTIPGQFDRLIAADATSLWVSTNSGVHGFDSGDGHRIADVSFQDACMMEIADGTVWVASCGDSALMGIDATTGAQLFHVPIDGYEGSGQMRYAGSVLWMAEQLSEGSSIRLLPFDASSGLSAGQPIEVATSDRRFSSDGLASTSPPTVFFAIDEVSAWLTDYGSGEVIRVGLPIANAESSDPQCLSLDLEGLISCEEALSIADRESGLGDIGAATARLTAYGDESTSSEIAVWEVTSAGVQIPMHGPGGGCIVSDRTVTINATTGEYLWEITSDGNPQQCPSGSPGLMSEHPLISGKEVPVYQALAAMDSCDGCPHFTSSGTASIDSVDTAYLDSARGIGFILKDGTWFVMTPDGRTSAEYMDDLAPLIGSKDFSGKALTLGDRQVIASGESDFGPAGIMWVEGGYLVELIGNGGSTLAELETFVQGLK